MVARQGAITEADGYMYISVSVKNTLSAATSFRLYLVKYVPTFAVDKTKIASSAITITENGAGIGTLICNIGGVDYDFLTTSKFQLIGLQKQ